MQNLSEEKLTHEEWNDKLKEFSLGFARRHPDATVLICSSWVTFTRVLDDPTAFGFEEGDQSKRGGSIWLDHSHPTSKMHDEIAKDVLSLLRSLKPSQL